MLKSASLASSWRSPIAAELERQPVQLAESFEYADMPLIFFFGMGEPSGEVR